MAAVTALGHRVMAAIARSLELPEDYFARRYTADPLILFRIFLYPSRPVPEGLDVRDGVGEHTDYGLLTLLRQDGVGGLQVRTAAGWIEAPPIEDSFVCNIGDMLDRMTGGLYRSTPHRVRLNSSGRDRLSFPLFFDPDMAARIEPIRSAATDDHATRWDGASVHAFEGTLRRLPARQDRQGLPRPQAQRALTTDGRPTVRHLRACRQRRAARSTRRSSSATSICCRPIAAGIPGRCCWRARWRSASARRSTTTRRRGSSPT